MGLFTRVPSINPTEAAAKIEAGNALVVDVRERNEWNAGHIPGAKHIPLSQLDVRAQELPRDRTIIAACRSGARSARATSHLNNLGFEALNLSGGTASWHRARLPLEPVNGYVA